MKIIQMKRITQALSIVLLCGMMVMVISQEGKQAIPDTNDMILDSQIGTDDKNPSIVQKDDSVTSKEPLEETTTEDTTTEEIATEETATESITENTSKEDGIYSFFQRSEAWHQGVAWSGEWSTFEYKGKVFSDFGCGLCCMANVYDTLSPYEVSPKDMFFHAMNVSGYSPSGAGAAISWWNMKTTLTKSGIVCKLYHKPSSYAEFQQQISQCASAIVLVSSVYDNTYWTTTKGHYVSVWNYDKESDTVFLADPGMISRNRQRIPLRYVYNALKLSSDYQFLVITEYVEENNTWKGNGIKEQWYMP